ncbi:MAG TPA: hypothetical protein VMZ52_06170 [Bryobacteraceae bacterium]|nr:hypothetical protein [Bryobacteraceae bacterium]
MKNTLYASLLVGFAALAGSAVEPSAKLFENDEVKVVRAVEKPHVKGKFHEHKVNRVMIYMQPGTQRFEYQDGRKPQVFHWKAGQVKWNVAEGMHSPETTTDEPFNIIEIELKKPAGGKKSVPAQDVLKVDPKHYKLEFENDQVRVLRVKVGPHESIPMHEHALNRVSVPLTDQNVRSTDAQGKVETVQHKAGEAAWGTAKTHKEENLNDKPLEIVIVELKS